MKFKDLSARQQEEIEILSRLILRVAGCNTVTVQLDTDGESALHNGNFMYHGGSAGFACSSASAAGSAQTRPESSPSPQTEYAADRAEMIEGLSSVTSHSVFDEVAQAAHSFGIMGTVTVTFYPKDVAEDPTAV